MGRGVLLVGVLMVAVIAVAIDYQWRSGSNRQMERVAQLTGVATPALGLSYHEASGQITQMHCNQTYPQMMPIKKRDFLYAH